MANKRRVEPLTVERNPNDPEQPLAWIEPATLHLAMLSGSTGGYYVTPEDIREIRKRGVIRWISKHLGISEEHYAAWCAWIAGMGQCTGRNAKGKPCGNPTWHSIGRRPDLADFRPGVDDRCAHHGGS